MASTSETEPPSLPSIVSALCEDLGEARQVFPSRRALITLLEMLRRILFPLHFDGSRGGATVHPLLEKRLQQTLAGLTRQLEPCLGIQSEEARRVALRFLGTLPSIRAQLMGDARAAFDGDPAAKSIDETIYCYPGLFALTNHRIANALHRLEVPLLPRMIAEQAHGATGIDIHPGATIGGQFFIDHGTGVVIGETCVIGERVRVYQGVTLGAKSLPAEPGGRSLRGAPRHPIVEDDVVIYSNATILGRITLGRGSTIGGNVWLTRSVPPGSFVSQTPNRSDRFDQGGGI